MSTTLYYFSGTGNSLHIAKKLLKHIPNSNLVPIAALLNRDSDMKEKSSNKQFRTTTKSIGFIFPCHGLTIPIPVKTFLKRLDLSISNFIFAIVTRGGSVFRGFSVINKILKKQNKKLNASFVINMWMNDPKLKAFSMPKEEDLEKIEQDIQNKLPFILKIIKNQEFHHDDVSGITFSRSNMVNYILERLVAFAVHHVAPKVKKYFYSDSNCTGCGICEKVCLSKKIKLIDSKPIWQKDVSCFYCYSCLNYCPAQAIQIASQFYMKSYTSEKGRYPHPYAKVKDIANQKNYPTST